MRRVPLFIALALALTAVPALAQEGEGPGMNAYKAPGGLLDKSVHERQNQLSVFLEIPWYGLGWGGFPIGVGGRFYIPLMKDGFIPAINDEFGIEFGADLAFLLGSYPNGFGMALDIPVEVRWIFHITPDFSAHATAGLALQLLFNGGFGVFGGYNNGLGTFYGYGWSPVMFYGGAGITYRIAPGFLLRADIGYPALRVGLTWPL
jgi:hypothetical protein